MNSNPIVKREKFSTWIIDLRNVLGTHHKTRDLHLNYPADIDNMEDNVDRAVKTLLFTITSGSTKKLVGAANSGHQALMDIRRHFGGVSKSDTQREKLNLMTMKQFYSEKATAFLKRVRNQLNICATVGCYHFHSEAGQDDLINIILEGLNDNIKLYSATIADLKSKYRTGSEDITLESLESLFFGIDDSTFGKKTQKEHAHYFHGQRRRPNNKFTSTKPKFNRILQQQGLFL